MSSREQEPTTTTTTSGSARRRTKPEDSTNLLAVQQQQNDFDEGRALKSKENESVDSTTTETSMWNDLASQFQTMVPWGSKFKLPPIQIDDTNLLLYDVFLLLNLSVSISFWVVNRMQMEYIALAFNEGCLLSILWIMAGLYHGAFLDSAMDGHQRPGQSSAEGDQTNSKPQWWQVRTNGGPPAAGLLALNTFVNTINLRLIVALVVAVAQHRPVFEDPLEQLIPFEAGFGLILMSVWRTIHSAYTPRI